MAGPGTRGLTVAFSDMFSPLADPDGIMLYELITHLPPASHLALSPFDLYREPLVVVALADGEELRRTTFSKRRSAGGPTVTTVENNIRALDQELEDLRDAYPKPLVHQVLIFDYAAPPGTSISMPHDGIKTVPPLDHCVRTTLKTVMCDLSSLLLAEMRTLAKSLEALPSIDSPGHYSTSRHMNGASWSGDGGPLGPSRRNSQHSAHHRGTRSVSAARAADTNPERMSMPPPSSHSSLNASHSTPGSPPSPPTDTSVTPHLAKGSDGAQSLPNLRTSTPEPRPSTPSTISDVRRDGHHDRTSVHGFGPGTATDGKRRKGKGRISIVIGSMFLQAGLWTESLKQLTEGATASKHLNDHIWHGKALELIIVNLILLAWTDRAFEVPSVCLPPQEKPGQAKPDSDVPDLDQPMHLRKLQALLPELLERVISFYSRVSTESLLPLPFAETVIRFSKMLSAIHLCDGKLNRQALDAIVMGELPKHRLTASPRLTVIPSRQQITSLLFRGFPSHATELLTTSDRVSILCGIASVLESLGLRRKKAMVVRELVSVLVGGLVEARTRGAAEAGVHPAAGLLAVSPVREHNNSAVALDLGEDDIEQGMEAFLQALCRSYGVPGERTDRTDGGDRARDSDDAIIARIQRQCASRFLGFPSIKLNILRACINVSEALPDLNGVLKFSSELMRNAGSGVAPGARRENASASITRDEQLRLAANISRTVSLAQRIGLTTIEAEYWDEFLLRGVRVEPLPSTRVPIAHPRSALPGATDSRTSQDVNPFIYNPFLKQPDEATVNTVLIAGEWAVFKVTLQNTLDIEVEVESLRLETEGVSFESMSERTTLGSYRTQALNVKGRPSDQGLLRVTGAIIKVRGCRERRFPIFTKAWVPVREEIVKTKGIAFPECDESSPVARAPASLETDSLVLNVIRPLPLLEQPSVSLPQSSIMILEGERQRFIVTLRNQSSTPVDFILFSFKDSTQDPLQAALSNRNATPAELYEYELILLRKQALRLPRSDQPRQVSAGGEATFEFEILGKPGLTHATIQVDYTHLGVPRDDVKDQFYTRQVSVDLMVTVNAGVELVRIDALPVYGQAPQSLWERLGAKGTAQADAWCLLSMDLRNAWPSQMAVRIEGGDDVVIEEDILPGNTSRILMPVKRIYLEDAHASIPTLNPSQTRQFVVSSNKVSPEMERLNREAFWYRESVLEGLRATWRTTSRPCRSGAVELRTIRLSPRMIETIKVDEVGIETTVEDADGRNAQTGETGAVYVDETVQLRVRVTNRTNRSILPLVRVMPALCHRPLHVALDYARKLAWNGTLQQALPEIEGRGSAEVTIGMTPLCRGEFEVTVSVEEVQVWEDASEEATHEDEDTGEREREEMEGDDGTRSWMDTALEMRGRRIWHGRRPCILTVRDRE